MVFDPVNMCWHGNEEEALQFSSDEWDKGTGDECLGYHKDMNSDNTNYIDGNDINLHQHVVDEIKEPEYFPIDARLRANFITSKYNHEKCLKGWIENSKLLRKKLNETQAG